MRRTWVFALLGTAGIIAGCGQKGPLVLPDARPRVPVNANPPAPAAPTPKADKAVAKPDTAPKP